MSTVAVIGIAGEKELWLVDFTAGTVTPFTPGTDGEVAGAVALREGGATVIKGIDLAVSVSPGAQPASSHHEP